MDKKMNDEQIKNQCISNAESILKKVFENMPPNIKKLVYSNPLVKELNDSQGQITSK